MRGFSGGGGGGGGGGGSVLVRVSPVCASLLSDSPAAPDEVKT